MASGEGRRRERAKRGAEGAAATAAAGTPPAAPSPPTTAPDGQSPEGRLAVAGRLDGRHFFITGATGFLGTALVERILRTLPAAEVVVLVRPTRRASAEARAAREILRNDCFARLRRETGDKFDQEVASRLTAVAGDVRQDGLGLAVDGRRLLAGADVVVHSAATVSFDAPLDQAGGVNLLVPAPGGAAVAATRREVGADPAGAHLVAVSTAYVAGTHQGEAKEELLTADRFTLDIDWRAEVDHARRLRADLEAESRRPDRLGQFAKKAREELGAAGEHLLAARAERQRHEWIKQQLIDAGSTRAQALGWPDAYPFTKALGERALIEGHGAGVAPADDVVPLTVVRPSIMESSLAEPVPGWIRGFRMAEPIIISFARGLLREFPGVPEGVIDVIPVDLVVAAILVVAAAGRAGLVTADMVKPGAAVVGAGTSWDGRKLLSDVDGGVAEVAGWMTPRLGGVGPMTRAMLLRNAVRAAERA